MTETVTLMIKREYYNKNINSRSTDEDENIAQKQTSILGT